MAGRSKSLTAAAAVAAAGIVGMSVAWACTPSHNGTLAVNPSSAEVGDLVDVSGSYLKANTEYNVRFLDPTVAERNLRAGECLAAGQLMEPNPAVTTGADQSFGPVKERIPQVTTTGQALICVHAAAEPLNVVSYPISIL